MKRKFRILINGKNFLLDLGKGLKKHGFYTTRYIEAADASQAENLAVELIRKDGNLKSNVLNKKSDPPMLYAKDIVELESFDDANVPGKGYTFYIEKKE